MDGGRKKWIAEGRDLDTAPTKPAPSATPYRPSNPDYSLRAFLPQVQQAQKCGERGDDRRAQPAGIHAARFSRLPGCPKPASAAATFPARAAFPGAKPATTTAHSSRSKNCKSFTAPRVSSVEARDRLLPDRRALQPHLVRAEVSAGRHNVRNYDGSWTEWGNLVGAPVEKGAAKSVRASVKPELQRAQSGCRRVAGESDHVSAGRQVAHQSRQCFAGSGAGANCRRHARGRRISGIGARQEAAFAHQAPGGLKLPPSHVKLRCAGGFAWRLCETPERWPSG